MSNKNTILKNTTFLYIRMFLILGVTLYTSRIILEQLGVSDYGIYSLVGGIVSMLAFFRGAMANATRRYLAYDIGKNDFTKLKKTFSTSVTIHFIIALFILLIAETLGLWYLENKMVFTTDRKIAVNFVFQFSVLTFIVNIIQVPYDALIQARERMKVYAYISIIEVLLKLISVYLLLFFNDDKLIIFSILTFLTSLIIRIIYLIYCRRNFKESKYKFEYDKIYFKELMTYSGWNLFGNLAIVTRNQGTNIVLNLFFGTLVNASYGITAQVQSALMLFVNNFQLAINPQIIKSFAQGDLKRNHLLISQGAKLSYFLLLIIILPSYFNINFILELWLNNVPNYTSIFVKLTFIYIIIDSISGTLMVGVQATGKIKWYQIIVGTLLLLNLPISYILLKSYEDPSLVFYVMIFFSIVTLFTRLLLLKKIIDLEVFNFFKNVILPIVLVSIITISLAVIITKYLYLDNEYLNFIVNSGLIVLSTIFTLLIVGLNKDEKIILKNIINRKIKR